MLHLQNRLHAYVITLIGLGMLILVGDGIVILLRILGIEKWTAFYMAILIMSISVSLAFNRVQSHTVQEELATEDEAPRGETS